MTTTMATTTIRPLSPALGAEVTGIDLRQPLDPATVKALRDAFDQNIVLCIRDQKLSEDDQLRAAGYFGKVHVRRKPSGGRDPGGQLARSEEHTSELQSRENLVCRLLLEKKKKSK